MEVVDNVKRFKEKGILDETHSRDKLDAQLIVSDPRIKDTHPSSRACCY